MKFCINLESSLHQNSGCVSDLVIQHDKDSHHSGQSNNKNVEKNKNVEL